MKIKTTLIQKIILFIFSIFIFLITVELFLQLISTFYINYNLKKNNNKNKQTIVCFGDSFTYGLGSTGINNDYPAILEKKLKNTTILNFGVPGYNSSQILTNIKKYFEKNKADILIFLGGVNNLWNSTNFNNTPKNRNYYFKFKTIKLFKLLYFRLMSITKKKSITKKTNPNSIVKRKILIKELWFDKIFQLSQNIKFNNELSFFKKFLKQTRSSEFKKYYNIIDNKINNGYYSTIKKIKKILKKHPNSEKINYLYALYTFKYNKNTGHINDFYTKFPKSNYSNILRAETLNNKEYNKAIKYLLIALNNLNNKIDDDLLKITILKKTISISNNANNFTNIEDLITNNYNKDSYLYIYFKCLIYFNKKQFKLASDLLFNSKIIKKYKDFYNIKIFLDLFKQKKYKIASKNMFHLMFTNIENSFIFDYCKNSIINKDKDGFQILLFHFNNDPFNSRVWASIGKIFNDNKCFDLAEKAFNLIKNNNSAEDDLICYKFFYSINKKEMAFKYLENWYKNTFSKNEYINELISLSIELNYKDKVIYYLNESKHIFGNRSKEYLIFKAEFLYFINNINKCYNILKTINSDKLYINLKKAILLKKLNKFNLSYNIFKKCSLLFPDNEIVKNELLQLNIIINDFNNIKKYIKLKNKDLNYEKILYKTAKFYFNKFDYKNAKKCFWACYCIDPNNIEYSYKFLICLFKLKQYNKANIFLKKIPEVFFLKRPEFKCFNAYSNISYKNIKNAENICNKLLDIHFNNKKVILNCIEIFYLTGNKKKFLKLCKIYENTLKKEPEFYFLNAKFYMSQNINNKALPLLNKILELDKYNYTSLDLIGVLFKNNKKESLKYFKKSFLISLDINNYASNLSLIDLNINEKKYIIQNAYKITKIKKSSLFYDPNKASTILKNDLYKILNICNKNNCKLIIQNYPSNKINIIINKFAKESHTQLIDNSSIFKLKADNSYFIADGHCNNKGYELMANNIFNIIKKAIK